ncbi:MAG: arginine deiminase family protein [Gemmatimonadetes bacterium]|nr:arginine deiminase family protein [Gemmatimonadota bacterium]
MSDAILRCELTHLSREPIDVAAARTQHGAYEAELERAGCRVVRLPDTPDLPDAVFVEDTAIVLDEIAVIAHPGAASRRAETASVAELLARYRPLCWIQPPATLDGGDVLVMDRTITVGRSGRTSADGVEQLRRIAEPFDYDVREVTVTGCLHLKSAVTCVAPDVVLLNPDWVDRSSLGSVETIEIDPAEPFAANALRIGAAVLHGAVFARTRERIERRGLDVRPIDFSELAKAEGGVTCCSIVFEL